MTAYLTITAANMDDRRFAGLVDLTEQEAWALSQLLVRIQFPDLMRLAAIHDQKAQQFRDVAGKLQGLLADAGIPPR